MEVLPLVDTIYNPPHLIPRQQPCDICNLTTPVCCGGGAYCCPTGAVCSQSGWCCPAGGSSCPGVTGLCRGEGQTCCGRTVCDVGSTCCGRRCCGPGTECSDGVCINVSPPTSTSTTTTSTTTSRTTTTSTTTRTTSAPIVLPPIPDPTETIDDDPITPSDESTDPVGPAPTPSAPASTPSTALTVLPFAISTQSNSQTLQGGQTNQNDPQGAQLASSDAIALVLPWDPRIEYSPESAWISTTASSTIGNCRNGTKVSNQAGSSIRFAFEGKQIGLLICEGSKAGDLTVQVDGGQASEYNGWKDPSLPGSNECIITQPFTSDVLNEGWHNITVIVKGSRAGSLANDSSVEFGGFVYRGERAIGTEVSRGPNLPAIIGGTIGGVVGGFAVITLIVVLIVLRRRKRKIQRIDDAPASVHQIPAPAPVSSPAYSTVPTTEYYDPYVAVGYGRQQYPDPTTQLDWAQTSQGPFGSGSYIAGGDHSPRH